MIIGGNKKIVIQNIKRAVKSQELNKKVEINDPQLSLKQEKKLLKHFLKEKNSLSFHCKNITARFIMKIITWYFNQQTKISGLNNIKNVKEGAILTSNHFNPLDNTAIRKVVYKAFHSHLYIISQPTNLKMPGIIGFFMRYDDIIPIGKNLNYLGRIFPLLIKKLLKARKIILIYPEQEMWFNYRKPRPLKRGAYYYAAKFKVPIISCFVEIKNLKKADNNEFNQVSYIVHILKTIYPKPEKNIKENCKFMMKKDYNQKKEAYEEAYHKKLDYTFNKHDIAGWRA